MALHQRCHVLDKKVNCMAPQWPGCPVDVQHGQQGSAAGLPEPLGVQPLSQTRRAMFYVFIKQRGVIDEQPAGRYSYPNDSSMRQPQMPGAG